MSRWKETPPRAWGRHFELCRIPVHDGNTPTCVGKTNHAATSVFLNQKHPHVRGEDPPICHLSRRSSRNTPTCVGKTALTVIFNVPNLETPPRAWGRLSLSTRANSSHGNTPTCVGKTMVKAVVAFCAQKHPHVRGEDTKQISSLLSKMETPPRAWGRRTIPELESQQVGNTPTCVGKTIQRAKALPGE